MAGATESAVSQPECVWPVGAQLGEGPCWSAAEQAVWFVDIKGRAIHRYHEPTGQTRSWAAPSEPGFVLPARDGSFIAGLETGLHRFDPATGAFRLLQVVEPQAPNNRLNDGNVDANGYLWFGSMDDNEKDPTGALYQLLADGCRRRDDNYVITNGPTASPDGRTLYHTDTLKRIIYAFDKAPDGTLTNRRVFAQIGEGDGHPDGPITDTEDCIWSGLFGGWGINRYSAQGRKLSKLAMPVANVTKAAFGGKDLRTLYVTTAWKGLSARERAIATIAAIGGSTNAQPHLVAMARHAGVDIGAEDWMTCGREVPLIVNMQPAGKYLGERFHRAGGVPAVLCELLRAGRIDGSVPTVTGRTLAQNIAGRESTDREVITTYEAPLQERAGFLVLKGNLFDFAIMKTSVLSPEFCKRYLSGTDCFEGRAVVFDGSEDYHARINDPALGIDERTILVIRGSGPVGWPGSAEVVNMQPPDALLKRGITSLPTIGDGRQSGTSDSPSILNASPESAVGGGLAWLRTGDVIRIDLSAGRCDMLVSDEEIARRKQGGPPAVPESATPWQEIYRSTVSQLDRGGVMELALKYRGVGAKPPRHNH